MNLITDDQLIVFDKTRTRAKYEEISSGSAIYPGQGSINGLAYVALKLTGEVAELAEAAMADDVVKEAGDVLWYLGAMHRELEVVVRPETELDVICAEYGAPPVNPDVINLIAAGKIGELVGKAMRDDKGELSANSRALIINHMSAIFVGVAQYLNIVQVSMTDAMLVNLEKLRDRAMRGTLHGSGDDR